MDLSQVIQIPTNIEGKYTVVKMTNGNVLEGKVIKAERNGDFVLLPENETLEIKINFNDIIYLQIKNNYNILDPLRIDSKLKKEYKYTDDFETFKKKLAEKEMKIEDNILENKSYTIINSDNTPLEENQDERNWNQFDLNKEKFKVDSTYDEANYTTGLLKDTIPDDIIQKAEIIEKSITRDRNKNRHINEERGNINENLNNEEEEEFKYSSVYRNNLSHQKHSHKIKPIDYFSWKLFLIFLIVIIITTIFLHNKKLLDNITEIDEEDYIEHDDEE